MRFSELELFTILVAITSVVSYHETAILFKIVFCRVSFLESEYEVVSRAPLPCTES